MALFVENCRIMNTKCFQQQLSEHLIHVHFRQRNQLLLCTLSYYSIIAIHLQCCLSTTIACDSIQSILVRLLYLNISNWLISASNLVENLKLPTDTAIYYNHMTYLEDEGYLEYLTLLKTKIQIIRLVCPWEP